MKFYTKTPGIGGRIKQRIEDFRVDEIPIELAPGEEYTVFWMEKFNWDTHQAIREIARKLHTNENRLGVAGTKDKRAVTKQKVSAWNIDIGVLEKINIRDIKLSDFEKSGSKLSLGDLHGNNFKIIIRDIGLDEKEIEKRMKSISDELKKGIPNIFGPQRFGEVRVLTHLVGREMLRGRFEEAVRIYLCKIFDGEPEDAKRAREELDENWNKEGFKRALKNFPERLKYERSMIEYLYMHPIEYAGALRRLPKKLRKMFLNAYQSYIWNEVVVGVRDEKLTLPGYDTKFDRSSESDKRIMEFMKRDGISPDGFLMKHMPELKCSGSERETVLKVSDMTYNIGKDEINEAKATVAIEFSLPPGSYATVVLREIMKN